MAAFLEKNFGMRCLEVIGPDLGRWDVRRNGQHRHARAMAIEQAIDEMQIARPAAAGADGELARQVRLGAGREGGYLLMADMDPFDPALAPNRVGQAVQAVADYAVDAFHTGGRERCCKLIGYSR